MKTATLPSLRVEAELREAAESVLKKGESLSSFVEESVRTQVRRRQMQDEFIKRGLASLEESRQTGVYYALDEVIGELRAKLDQAKARHVQAKTGQAKAGKA